MTERIMTEPERELLSNYLSTSFVEGCAWGLCGILDHAEECASQPAGIKTWGICGSALTLGIPATPDTEDDANQP